jgi:hypothetical protein
LHKCIFKLADNRYHHAHFYRLQHGEDVVLSCASGDVLAATDTAPGLLQTNSGLFASGAVVPLPDQLEAEAWFTPHAAAGGVVRSPLHGLDDADTKESGLGDDLIDWLDDEVMI